MNFILILLLIADIIIIANNFFLAQSRYLYFSTEFFLILISIFLYKITFSKTSWDSPPEKIDKTIKNHKNIFFKNFIFSFVILTTTWLILWILNDKIFNHYNDIIQKAYWFSYFFGIFLISIILGKKNFKYISQFPLIISVSYIWTILTSYEIILLSKNQGWIYQNVIIGNFLGVPLGSMLFVYIFAPALSIIFYTMISKGLNDKKAFFIFTAIMVISSIIIELIGIYIINLWTVDNKFSILPIGNSNIEEFIYYIIFNVLSVEIYYLLKTRLK